RTGRQSSCCFQSGASGLAVRVAYFAGGRSGRQVQWDRSTGKKELPTEDIVIKDDLVALFSSNAIRAGAGTRRVGDAHKLRQTVSELIGGAGSVYCPGVTETESAV